MRVSSSERGLVRLFSVALPAEDIQAFRDPTATTWPLLDALGATALDMDHVELFDVSDLEDLGLSGYMVEGLGIAQRDVDEDAARLTNQTGWVLMVRSAAFEGVAQDLSAKAPLTWIGSYAEEGAPVRFEALPNRGAKGINPPPETAPAQQPRNPYLTVLIALLVLPLLAALIGGLIVWGRS